MLDILRLARHAVSLLGGGAGLHHRALHAAHTRQLPQAERLFEAAAACYRRELDVEALARLRIHQMMARVLGGADPESQAQSTLEIERRLCRIECIESPYPPFELVDARSVLASWARPAVDREHETEQRVAA
jgi:hypothetical protein